MPPRTEIRDYPAFHAMPPHMHDTASMNIVLRGGFVERMGRAERHYSRGYVAYFPAGVVHSQQFGSADTRQIVFRPEDSWLDYLVDCKARLGEAPCLNSLAFPHLGDRLFHEIRARDEFADIACEGILLEVVAQFGRQYAAARRPPKPPAWLNSVRDFLHARPAAAFRMTDLARVAGRHEVHVAREFRRFYGLSVGAYLRKLRLESAALKLADPRAAICAIALECGFSSHSHLCREFKRRFGLTPAQYRAGHR
ncbi:MAG TPA: helix-turn-helix domain-containing protein [Rhizomicrobium sp.]|jgi:AraC family transcriptional regulator|nr:helix-turn-helix domain-containing protein [Rhizomicrobium sp.]